MKISTAKGDDIITTLPPLAIEDHDVVIKHGWMTFNEEGWSKFKANVSLFKLKGFNIVITFFRLVVAQ